MSTIKWNIKSGKTKATFFLICQLQCGWNMAVFCLFCILFYDFIGQGLLFYRHPSTKTQHLFHYEPVNRGDLCAAPAFRKLGPCSEEWNLSSRSHSLGTSDSSQAPGSTSRNSVWTFLRWRQRRSECNHKTFIVYSRNKNGVRGFLAPLLHGLSFSKSSRGLILLERRSWFMQSRNLMISVLEIQESTLSSIYCLK